MLLPSRPDMVHRRRLHGTRQSTPLTGTCLTGTRLKTGVQPCCSGLQVQGTAISPSGATAYSIRSFVRFCKCKECKFVNLSQIGAGFRRKREPRGAGEGRKSILAECQPNMAKTKCVSLCLRYVIYMLFSLLFIFSLSQSAYTWGFGLQGRSPLP